MHARTHTFFEVKRAVYVLNSKELNFQVILAA